MNFYDVTKTSTMAYKPSKAILEGFLFNKVD